MLQHIDLSQVLLIDIETVPQYRVFTDMPEEMRKLWAAKTIYQRKDVSAEDFYERAGIWAEFGKIICISCGRLSYKKGIGSIRIKSFFGHDEKMLLADFCTLLNNLPTAALLCAHNGKEFDFPYLCRRLLINGLPIPTHLQFAGKKPWEVPHLDTMELWKFGDYKSYISLDLLAAVFNIPTPKDDIDGSDVASVYYQENDLQRIVKYCQKDVATTAQVLLKFKGEEIICEDQITVIQ